MPKPQIVLFAGTLWYVALALLAVIGIWDAESVSAVVSRVLLAGVFFAVAAVFLRLAVASFQWPGESELLAGSQPRPMPIRRGEDDSSDRARAA